MFQNWNVALNNRHLNQSMFEFNCSLTSRAFCCFTLPAGATHPLPMHWSLVLSVPVRVKLHHLQQASILQGKHLWWKHLERYYCTLRNATAHLEMGTVTEKLQLDQSGIKEFADSNTCCPGVQDQWQGRAPSDILSSESKQLNILNLHSHGDVWNRAWLISKRDNTNEHE